MANDIKLGNSKPVDKFLRPLKVNGEPTSLETSLIGNGSRVNGDLEVTGTLKSNQINAQNAIISDGDITLDADVKIGATKKLYIDGGTDTYLTEISADSLQIVVGGDIMLQATESGADGNVIHFRADTSVGFSRLEATFSTTGAFAFGDLGGTDDTDIDFRFSNKYRLEMTGDITNMNLIFPNVSGNFLLVCTTNGDHDVTNWKVYEYDESAATTTDVMWAGGSVPAFTSSGIDIVSFYWDATEQQAYGVASLAFAAP